MLPRLSRCILHIRSTPTISFAMDIERKEPHESTGYRIAHPLVIVAGWWYYPAWTRSSAPSVRWQPEIPERPRACWRISTISSWCRWLVIPVGREMSTTGPWECLTLVANIPLTNCSPTSLYYFFSHGRALWLEIMLASWTISYFPKFALLNKIPAA